MDSSSANTLTVSILDREYQVACPQGQEQQLLNAALELDKRMRDVRKSSSVVGLERVLVMAALNLSYDLLQTHQDLENAPQDKQQLEHMNSRIDEALALSLIHI